jgi:hypothetical protein
VKKKIMSIMTPAKNSWEKAMGEGGLREYNAGVSLFKVHCMHLWHHPHPQAY